jgi:hypothetical protein
MISASQAGMQIVLLLEGTPSWAVKPGYTCGVVREDYFSEFSNFAKEVIKRYSSSPYNARILEIYNEPDAATFLGCWGDPNDTFSYGGVYYGQFLQSIYPAIKSFNSSIQVLVGGLLLDCDPSNPPAGKNCTSGRFFEGILSSGAGKSFDGVAFHSYDYYQGPGTYNNPNWHSDRTINGSSTIAKAAYLRSVMVNYGVAAKPLFNTEYALFCGDDNSTQCSSFQDVLEATKAYYIVEFMASAVADGYQTAIWYAIMSGRNNSLLKQDFTPLPVYNAYKFANQKIGNSRYSQRVNNENFFIYEFKKPNGTKLWIAWTKNNQAQTLTLPTLPTAVYRIGIDGNGVLETPATSINVDIAPVIIELIQ